jgi:hypothetical protein
MKWGCQKPLKWQKSFVAAVPYFENLLCFLITAGDSAPAELPVILGKPSGKAERTFR